MDKRPVIRLRPGKGRRFLGGAPWVFSDELVMDRRTRGIAPGAVAVLEGSDRQPIACVAVNPNSRIAARRPWCEAATSRETTARAIRPS